MTMRGQRVHGCKEYRLSILAGVFASRYESWFDDRVHIEVTSDMINVLKEVVADQHIVL